MEKEKKKCKPQCSHKLQLTFFSPSSKIGKVTVFRHKCRHKYEKEIAPRFYFFAGESCRRWQRQPRSTY